MRSAAAGRRCRAITASCSKSWITTTCSGWLTTWRDWAGSRRRKTRPGDSSDRQRQQRLRRHDVHAAHGLRYAHFSKCAGFTSFLECGSDPRVNLRVHAIVRDEELAAVGEQLAFGRVIERLDAV